MAEPKFTQFFIKFLDSKTLTLQFPNNQTLTPQSIKQKIQTLTNIPIESHQTLTLNGKLLTNTTQITPKSISLTTVYLNFPLLGGKGGFGSLLRGAATKAGQKKTNNFDACRDMSGRRLRHVNAEKKLEEWKAGEEERKLEKMAEEYLKKMEKKGKGGKRDESAEKYVEKYREDSRKCVEEVERSVRECFGGMKRKKGVEMGKEIDGDAKKLKIWMGKRKMGETDSDDSDTDSDEENEKSVVTVNGNQSDSSKDTSCASDPVALLNEDNHSGHSSDSGSEEEKEVVARGTPELATSSSGSHGQGNLDGPMDVLLGEEIVIEQDHDENHSSATTVSDQLPAATSVEPDVPELNGASECKSVSSEVGVTGSSNSSEVLKPLNFDDFNSAAELEVLGMERLKSELQERGLKCGGTLQERAARLFLLKTTPLDKLPKKLLAKK